MSLHNADDREFLAQFPNFANLSVPNCLNMVKKCPGIPGATIRVNPKGIQGQSHTHGDIRNPT
jgi:hypothetical protein